MTDFISSSLLANKANIIHGFFTRYHGISRTDMKQKLLDLEEIANIFKIDKKYLLTLSQIHSAEVIVIDANNFSELHIGDALITKQPGLLLGVLTSDCVPILLASSNGDMVAAIHAGWKGAKAGIIQSTINNMLRLGAKDIVAALGPCIWQQSYEVSKDFYESFKSHPEFFIKSSRENYWMFDLPGFVCEGLRQAGVKNIEHSLGDTYLNNNLFYSFRRKTHNLHEEYKNQISVIGISC